MSPRAATLTFTHAFLVGALFTALGAPRQAPAESALRLQLPESFGTVPALTYDEAGKRVGDAEVRIEREEEGRVTLTVASGIEGAERTVATADLIQVDAGQLLQIVGQTSQSVDGEGRALGVLSVNHRERIGRCAPPDGGDARTLRLPEADRIANVPLNLLFLPLVHGDRDEIEFQIFVCRGGPRLLDARARVATGDERSNGDAEPEIVEIHYELLLPSFLAAMARPFLPDISMWFDRRAPDPWIAHRMPLFSAGPTVMVVRSGTKPSLIAPDL